MSGEDLGRLIDSRLTDAEREIRHNHIMLHPANRHMNVFPLLSRSGRNLIICKVKKNGDSLSTYFDWFILHDHYNAIRQREIESRGPSQCLTNISLEVGTGRWMVHAKWRRGLLSLIMHLRRVLGALDDALVAFDELVKRYSLEMGRHVSCYLGCVLYLNTRIYYNLHLGNWINQNYAGSGLKAFIHSPTCLNGEIYLSRDHKALSFGINFAVMGSELFYELTVSGMADSVMRYIDAMFVEGDL
jgi:hypothetical protein